MSKIKAIIIDDEERARRVLKNMLNEFCKDVEVIDSSSNVPDGVLAINNLKPDVVFLDIEMPNYSGFELLGFFRDVDFEIVFVTAYSQYAIQAFEVSAVDYLLKPVQVEQLENAIQKVKDKINISSMQDRLDTLKVNLSGSQIQKIAVPVSDGLVFVKTEDISHINADGSYSKIYLADGTDMLVSKKLKYFEEMLEGKGNFYRVHRSHLVNLSFVRKYNRHQGQVELENDHKVNVSREGKSAFEDTLAEFHG
ncbi:LytTR family DNA-binding domain-containing protein [Paracrocinitomix mangrovi]|uniref:LytR/AlgR family response regulator transcription factor n=1 Tax=Paracrocinitomix mangrovi TaxID=2862509 RepID=UPI001C8E0F27|nr:LytTR family DNA-binding domain-containing protein [Paracrocinitomix mangrovi]UKN03510.1 LytTR family DNA-binding domain-containing protein [Paracrocinitomix mangrovi]